MEILTSRIAIALRLPTGFLVGSAAQHGDFDLPRRAIAATCTEFRILKTNPFTCRIANADRIERELVIPFRASGYVALFWLNSWRQGI